MIAIAIRRNTVQKSLVLETVNKLRSHATADQVYEDIVLTHPSISRATVYRNLNQLADSGEIKRVAVPNGADRFDHMCLNHYHVRCFTCGDIFDVEMDYIEDLEKTIKNANGFDFQGHDIIFSGICPKCQLLKEAHTEA